MSDPEIFTKINDLLKQGESIVLCTLFEKVGSGPREPGSKMIITMRGEPLGTIGGGEMERVIITQALECLKEGKPRIIHFAMGVPAREGMIVVNSKCGGEVKILMDIVKPEPRLFIMGSGWIAQATAQFAKYCGFEVIVIDDASTAKLENFPGCIIINDPYPDSLEKIDIRSSDYIAILHGETLFELAALRKAFKAKSSYIGLLGSENKAKRHKETLLAEGFNKKLLETLHSPIGIEINAEIPEEIGVSILAELIKNKRK